MIANLQGTRAGAKPQRLEWKYEEWNGPRNVGHHAAEVFW